jgi:hypothetical protein
MSKDKKNVLVIDLSNLSAMSKDLERRKRAVTKDLVRVVDKLAKYITKRYCLRKGDSWESCHGFSLSTHSVSLEVLGWRTYVFEYIDKEYDCLDYLTRTVTRKSLRRFNEDEQIREFVELLPELIQKILDEVQAEIDITGYVSEVVEKVDVAIPQG